MLRFTRRQINSWLDDTRIMRADLDVVDVQPVVGQSSDSVTAVNPERTINLALRGLFGRWWQTPLDSTLWVYVAP